MVDPEEFALTCGLAPAHTTDMIYKFKRWRIMANIPAFPLSIFFDGSCSVCASNMDFYQKKEHGGRLRFIDITAPDFNPAPYGIHLDAFMLEMHAIDDVGQVYRGVDAFRAIWQAFPASTRYGLLGAFVTLPGVNLLARLTYWSFARLRRFLPTGSVACKDGSCRIGNHLPRK